MIDKKNHVRDTEVVVPGGQFKIYKEKNRPNERRSKNVSGFLIP